MRRPHLLLVAMFFPPSRASGVYRPLAMANFFAARGWRVSVITATRDFFEDITGSIDPTLEGFIAPEIDVIRVPVPAGHLQTDVRKLGWMRANFPKLTGKIDSARLKVFPDRYSTWIPGVLRRALGLHARRPVDLVLATGNPWSAFEVARQFGRLTRLPYVLDFRDSCTLNQFSEEDAFPPDNPAQAAEARVVTGATRTVFVNEPMRAWHAAKYPAAAERMAVLENGYDANLVASPPFHAPDTDVPLRFGSVGTITEHWPHDAAWPGWRLARAEPELAGATVRLYGHLGFFPAAAPRIRRMLPDADGVTYAGAVAKADLSDVYGSFDVILMAIPSSRFVTAGKVYECMATGRPIVAIHSPESAASDPLRGYPLWFPVAELTAEATRDAIIAAARAARTMTEQDYQVALAHADKFRRERLLEPFEQQMRSIIND
jgi:glycosyltransferase involved in cell wall biosynthesis